MKNIDYKKTIAITLIIGGIILGINNVEGWGWLIFFGILIGVD
jgi:hypothetical protein